MEGYASFWLAVDKLIEEFDQNIFDQVDKPVHRRNEFTWESASYQQQKMNRRNGRGRGAPNWRQRFN